MRSPTPARSPASRSAYAAYPSIPGACSQSGLERARLVQPKQLRVALAVGGGQPDHAQPERVRGRLPLRGGEPGVQVAPPAVQPEREQLAAVVGKAGERLHAG